MYRSSKNSHFLHPIHFLTIESTILLNMRLLLDLATKWFWRKVPISKL